MATRELHPTSAFNAGKEAGDGFRDAITLIPEELRAEVGHAIAGALAHANGVSSHTAETAEFAQGMWHGYGSDEPMHEAGKTLEGVRA